MEATRKFLAMVQVNYLNNLLCGVVLNIFDSLVTENRDTTNAHIEKLSRA